MAVLPATFPAGIIGGLGAGLSSGVNAYMQMQHLKALMAEHHQRQLDREMAMRLHAMGRADMERERLLPIAERMAMATNMPPGEQPNAINFNADMMQFPDDMSSRLEGLKRSIGGPPVSPANAPNVQGPSVPTNAVPFNQLPPELQGAVSMGRSERYVKPSAASGQAPDVVAEFKKYIDTVHAASGRGLLGTSAPVTVDDARAFAAEFGRKHGRPLKTEESSAISQLIQSAGKAVANPRTM